MKPQVGVLALQGDFAAHASALERAGADVVELGVPFSDPLADGPVNQRAAQRALAAGCHLDTVLGIASSIRETSVLPMVLFTYFNPILRRGVERRCGDQLESTRDDFEAVVGNCESMGGGRVPVVHRDRADVGSQRVLIDLQIVDGNSVWKRRRGR